MKRRIVEIDEDLCDGCGLCVPRCAEGALKIVDGKARVVSDFYCDGLGACLGHCPKGAIRVVEKDAEPYDEWRVMERIVIGGSALIAEHLRHLSQHGQEEHLRRALEFLKLFGYEVPDGKGISVTPDPVGQRGNFNTDNKESGNEQSRKGPDNKKKNQWPLQLHLVNPLSPAWKGAPLLLAADCTAFVARNFHDELLGDRGLAFACPKLDEGLEQYVEKIVQFIDRAEVSSITVLIMEVPCCGGLIRLAQEGLRKAKRKIPLWARVLDIEGNLIREGRL